MCLPESWRGKSQGCRLRCERLFLKWLREFTSSLYTNLTASLVQFAHVLDFVPITLIMTVPRNSLRGFLAQARSALRSAIESSQKVTIVIGNESADLDSMTCSIL
jgi:hypothetical protein